MENAGATIEGGAILKGKGIGTQATCAEIIKKLFDTGYCEAQPKGKTNYIIPTAKGLTIIRLPRRNFTVLESRRTGKQRLPSGKKAYRTAVCAAYCKKMIILDCKRKNGEGTYKGKFTFIKKEIGEKVFTNLKCEPVKPERKRPKG